MITRFRLEAVGSTKREAERHINNGVKEILILSGETVDKWEVTDDVTWQDGPVYRARVVCKLRGGEGNSN